LLALDWDNHEFHLVAGSVRRGKVHIDRAVHWREETPFTPAQAEEFGKRLRQRLAESGVSPGPVIVGLGRDRLVVKEIRYPQIDPAEEPNLVRMQIYKELTEAPGDVAIDYCPLAETDRNGQRRALSLVVRKDLVEGIQEACRVAGLKVIAITARPLGIAACYRRLAGQHPQVPAPPAPDAVAAILTVTPTWADFTVVRGDQPLFARSVAVGDGLMGEVRRNLAAYAGQMHVSFPRDAIQALYVSGNGENAVLREKLQSTLGIPVNGMDPLVREERVDASPNIRAGFTGPVGLLQHWAEYQTLPANFVKPREARPAASPHKKRALVYGVLGVVLLALVVYGVGIVMARDRADREKLLADDARADTELKKLQPEAKYLEALKEWVDGDVSDLDELFDLVARMPWPVEGLRITKLEKTILPPQKQMASAGKDKDREKDKDKENQAKYLVRLNLTIKVLRKDNKRVQEWMEAINKDPHCKATSPRLSTVSNANDQENALQEYTMTVEIARQAANLYNTPMPNLKR
jgi:Tfp pilus assembly PilM family ATPase